MFWVNINDIETICFIFCKEFFVSFKRPIPPFTTRYAGKLESCLASPLLQFSGKDIYPLFEDKLTILFYLMNKNHPFLNGNKRMAVATLLVTLYGNNHWLIANQKVLYDLAVDVAGSDRKDKDKIMIRIKSFLKEHMVKIVQ